MLSHFSCVQLCVILWTVARQIPLSMNFIGKNNGVGYHFLLQGIFLTLGSNLGLLCLLPCQVDSLPLILAQGVGLFLEVVCVCLVTQSCLILCDPMDCSPSGSFVYGNPPGKITGMGCHALLQEIFRTQGYWGVIDDF